MKWKRRQRFRLEAKPKSEIERSRTTLCGRASGFFLFQRLFGLAPVPRRDRVGVGPKPKSAVPRGHHWEFEWPSGPPDFEGIDTTFRAYLTSQTSLAQMRSLSAFSLPESDHAPA